MKGAEAQPEDEKGGPLSAQPSHVAHGVGGDQPDTKFIPCCVRLCSAPHAEFGLRLRDGAAFCIVLLAFCSVSQLCLAVLRFSGGEAPFSRPGY